MLAGRLYGPASGLTNLVLGFQDNLVGLRRVYEIFDTAPHISDNKNLYLLQSVKKYIQFDNVSFSYGTYGMVLKNVNFSVKAGTTVALVGRSGAGKTTLVNLIARFYEPTSGSIFIDGYDISKIQLKSLRQQIGVVLQDPFLFSGTIKENITYGRQKATSEEVIKAAKAANIHEFIISLPRDYETIIGERGVNLSGGQRQRLAIARVLLRDPKILILDEATSSVDLESEALIQDALKHLMKNRTTFVIAHRLSTIKQADKILVIDKGEIVERGKHIELLKKKGLYSQLYERAVRMQ